MSHKYENIKYTPRPYDREEALQKLGFWPKELKDYSKTGTEYIVKVLKKRQAAQRRMGKAGHFAYNLTLHANLNKWVAKEEARLVQITNEYIENRNYA